MAKATTLIDDIDGKPNAAERHFSIGGTDYAIDLHDENYKRMLRAMEPYRSSARIARKTRRNLMPSLTAEDRKGIREYADKHGIYLAPRGRFPNNVIEAYFLDKAEADNLVSV